MRERLTCVLLIAFAMGSRAFTPVGSWSFESDGPEVDDASGHGLSGVAEECGRGPGHVGRALHLTGASGLIVPSSPLLRGAHGFTLECWIRSDVPPGPPMNIMTKEGEFMVRVDPLQAGGTISFYVWCDPGGWEPRARGPRLEANRWYRLIASWDGATLRFAVNHAWFSVTKEGVCPRTNARLLVGGPTEGLTGFRGLIDEVNVYNVPLGPIRIAKRAFGFDDVRAGPGAPQALFTFDETTEGWRIRGGGGLRVDDGVLTAEVLGPDTLLSVQGLAVPAATAAVCNLRMAAAGASRGVLVVVCDTLVKEVPFKTRAGAAMHTYGVPWGADERGGVIRGLGLHLDGAPDASLRIDSIELAGTSLAPPDVRILSLAPDRRINPLGRPVPVTCWLRNLGGPAREFRARLESDPRVRIHDEGERVVPRMHRSERLALSWHVSATAPLSAALRVRVEVPHQCMVHMERPIVFSADPGSDSVALARSNAWLRAGYPRAMDFRHLFSESVAFLEPNTALLVDMVPGKIEAAREFKRRYPDRLVLMQVNDEPRGLWGSWHCVPREFALKEGMHLDPDVFPMPDFRGYWLLGPGAPLTARFPDKQATCRVRVPRADLFVVNVYGKRLFRDVLLVPRADGQPDWTRSEYASLEEVDPAEGTITIRRWPAEAVGEWHTFDEGRSFVAPSVGSIYRLKTTWIKTWVPNLTRFCPRDPDSGLDAVTWWARHFAALWHKRIAPDEPHPDGLQFDGLDEGRTADCDGDGVLDACVIDGTNHWKLGQYDFFRKLRRGDGFEGMGDGLVLADASNVWGPRLPGVLNGSENEEFPSFAGPALFPTGFDLYRLWCANSAPPACPYLQGRFDCDTYLERDWSQARRVGKFHPDSLVRMSIAAACMGTGIYTFRTGSKRDIAAILYGDDVLTYPWDELHAGVEGEYNWLGMPLEPASRLVSHLGPDLLRAGTGTAGWQTVVEDAAVRLSEPAGVSGPGAATSVTVIGVGRRQAGAAARGAMLLSPATGEPLDADGEYALSLRISAPPGHDQRGGSRFAGVWRFVGLCLVSDAGRGPEQWILAGDEPRDVAVTLRPPHSGGACRIGFLIGAEPGEVRVIAPALHEGCAEVFTRRFECGLVLLNGSAVSEHAFDVAAVGGGHRYRRFLGLQDPAVNDGTQAEPVVVLGPGDGLLLRVAH